MSADVSISRGAPTTLTEEGARRLAPVREARRRVYRQWLNAWPTEDVATFATLLGRLNAASS